MANPKKPKMEFEDLFEKPHYSGILQMLLMYYTKTDGLRQAHFRYALMNNPNLGGDIFLKMEEFFRDDLKGKLVVRDGQLAKERHVITLYKGSIKSRQKLTNYLTKLVEMNIVKKIGKHPNFRYRLTDYYWNLARKSEALSELDEWSNENISHPFHEEFKINSYNGGDRIRLLGYSKKIFSNEEIKIIEECLNNIRLNARRILKIKYEKAKIRISHEEWERNSWRIFTGGEDKLKRKRESASFGILYDGHIQIHG